MDYLLMCSGPLCRGNGPIVVQQNMWELYQAPGALVEARGMWG